ncbi:MAG TPA: hypothetical protein VHM91_09685 [Verrucomicrobiales bacterium]|nr:hypothetical protein [Verrucomicrobiales bacterium]
MKTNIKAALLGALAASAAFVTVPALVPRRATAQETANAVAVSGSEQYRIISLNAVTNETSSRRMEDMLNRLAADGWRVRTGVGVAVILAR